MRYFTMGVRELYKSPYIYRRLSVATLNKVIKRDVKELFAIKKL